MTFRGNLTRTYYGKGPVPSGAGRAMALSRRAADCARLRSIRAASRSGAARDGPGNPRCSNAAGSTWVVFGAYDRAVHFLDATNGQRLLPDFPTGDIIKGSVTIDADGFPLVYTGSRDNYLRVLAIDRDRRSSCTNSARTRSSRRCGTTTGTARR